jgi:UDP-N-acetylmuramoyl-tripeptide--D-alanyl-D-alanine ligase
MIAMTVQEIADAVAGKILHLDPQRIITEYPVIDSRSAQVDTFFIALPGENLDGADFVEDAISQGATFALTHKESESPSIVVQDFAAALLLLAQAARQQSTETKFVGITGSQGKTTTKELLGHILSTSGETVVPVGSFNNEIGVPLTILRCTSKTKYCVLEMGARHEGDLAMLSKVAHPHVGVVLVVGRAHLGEFGDQAAVARAKGELIDNLDSGAIAILGKYDEFTPRMGEDRSDLTRILFGESSDCKVRASDVEMREGRAHFDLVTPAGRSAVSLRLIGAHQVANALAAAAVATALDIPLDTIAATLSTAEPTSKLRMELHDLGDFILINDSYNANPESMSAALSTLTLFAQERGGSSWAFLGKMHELGESERRSHQEIGRLASRLGIDHLVAVGTDLYEVEEMNTIYGESMSYHPCSDQAEALEVARHIEPGDSILVKASRTEKLDVLAKEIMALCTERIAEVEE